MRKSLKITKASLAWRKWVSRNRIVMFILLFAAVGTVILLQARALTPFVSLEPEIGNVTGGATVATDTTASNGKNVTFGKLAAATGKFYIVGKDIVDPDGNIFLPMGANGAIKLYSYNYVFEGGNGGFNQHIQEIKDWHWNLVRVNQICDNDSGTPSMDEEINGLATEVPKLTSQKIVVMLDCHDSTGKNPVIGDAKDQRIQMFWDRVAALFKNNPYVWFNIYNEPYNGAPDGNYVNLYQHYIDRYRSQGIQNIIVVDAPNYGQGIEYFAETNLGQNFSNNQCNVLLSWHAYGAYHGQQGSLSDFEGAIQAVQAKNLPLTVGELGEALPPENGNAGPWWWNVSGFDDAVQLSPKYGIGLQWWNATGDSSNTLTYSLKNDYTGYWDGGAAAKLSGPGQTYWNVSQAAQLNRGKFTGNLANSHCPGA